MSRKQWSARKTAWVLTVALVLLPALTAWATDYSKLVLIKLTGASNFDTYKVSDNQTDKVIFDATVNYYKTQDTFKLSLSLASLPKGVSTANVFLRAILLNHNEAPKVYYFVYDDSTAFPTIDLEEDRGSTRYLIENYSTSRTIDVLSFPVASDLQHADVIVLQAGVEDAGGRIIGMDAKVLFLNWLATQ